MVRLKQNERETTAHKVLFVQEDTPQTNTHTHIKRAMANEGLTTMTTPLLASAEEPPTSLSSPTSLAHHNHHHHQQQFSFDEEDVAPNSSSDFSRLLQLASRISASAHHSELVATGYGDSGYSSSHHPQQPHSSYPHDDLTLGSWFLCGGRESDMTHEAEGETSQYLFIITTGTLCILYTGLVLSSFMANVWTETWMQVQVPTILPPQWFPLGTANLSSLLQQLNHSSFGATALLLWMTTMLIPCCFIVVAPSQILYRNEFLQNSGSNKSDMKLRRFLELSVRWTLTVVWVEAIVACWGPHLVQLEWTRTLVSLHTTVGPGLACYTVACLCAILLTVVLRSSGPTRHSGMILRGSDHTAATSSEPLRMNRSIRSPPPHAFRQFQLPYTSNDDDDDDDDDDKTSPLLQILEETPSVNRLNRTSTGAAPPPTPDPPTKPLSFLQLLLVFQVGLLSILCIVPTLVLPAVTLKISGVASEFTPHRTLTVFLHQLPRALLHTTTSSSASWWLGWLVLVPTVVLPAAATAVAVRTWTHSSPHQRAVGRRWLYQWHPAVSGGVAAVAVVVALHVLGSWNVWSSKSNADHSLFCDALMMNDAKVFVLADGEPCWKVTVQSQTGLWFWVLQSVLLEAFIFLTLAWS